VDEDKKLQGILSISDIVLLAGEGQDKKVTDVSSADLAHAFKAICAPHPKAAAVGA
jgi:hypothetical protein